MTPAIAPSPPAPVTGSSAVSAKSSDLNGAAGSTSSTDTTGATGPPGTTAGTPANQFASVLEQVARTASAEGQDKTAGHPDGAASADKNASDPSAAVGTDPAADGLATALTLSAIAGAASAITGASTPTGSPQGSVGQDSSQTQGAQFPQAAPIDAATAATPATGAQAPADAVEATPAAGATVADALAPAASGSGTPGVDTPVAGPANSGHAGSSTTSHDQGSTDADAQPGSPQASPIAGTITGNQPSTTQPPAASAQSAATTSPAPAGQDSSQTQGAQFPQAAPIDAAQAQPSTSAAPANATTAARYSVGLEHAVETVRMTIDMAARQGASQARIQLSPAELGGIRIQLSQTADGLVARVVAEHGAAAQTLQQHGAELRRSLESAGVSLLRLDIEASGERSGSANEPFWSGARAGSQSHSSNPGNDPDLEGEVTEPQPVAVELSNGAIVNVLA